MPIKPMFNESTVKAYAKKKQEAYEAAVVANIRDCGNDFIKNARTRGNYTDRTANLRNSIGYVIFKDGEVLESVYPNDARPNPLYATDEGFSGKYPPGVGAKFGYDLAIEVGENFAPERGYLLVVTAGMEYAAFVEAGASEGRPNKRPYDVISGSAVLAEAFIKRAMARLHSKL